MIGLIEQLVPNRRFRNAGYDLAIAGSAMVLSQSFRLFKQNLTDLLLQSGQQDIIENVRTSFEIAKYTQLGLLLFAFIPLAVAGYNLFRAVIERNQSDT